VRPADFSSGDAADKAAEDPSKVLLTKLDTRCIFYLKSR
jgi:hypothetical protein